MCDKCKPIDDRIARYYFLRNAVADQKTVEGIDQLIQKLQMQKKDMHRDE